tara:strand:+ start:365 stop:1042 length:678 start_codon:yes stop_codon:yes gene_type:complete
MRHKLAPYRNQFVLAKGWIDDWEDLDECRRVFVKQPTIRKPNKELLFENQEIISTEHHLNLFIPHMHIPDFDTTFEMHNKISFSGYINLYTRSDGSKDYAVNTNEQSTILLELETLSIAIQDILNNKTCNSSNDNFLTDYALPKLKELEIRLEGYGDNLPTFRHNYQWYKDTISMVKRVVEYGNRYVQSIEGNRSFRRAHKKKRGGLFSKNLSFIKTTYTPINND